jgi:hypothetical protein
MVWIRMRGEMEKISEEWGNQNHPQNLVDEKKKHFQENTNSSK